MQPLIDGDILLHECSAIGQTKDGEILDFDFVSNILDQRIEEIEKSVAADQGSCFFITGDKSLLGDKFIPNFRYATAVTKPYKGTRTQPKPYHYRNLRAYALSRYNVNVANGCEADDELSITQTSMGSETIICSRDKDLRQCPGWHYGWEVGKQAEFGPHRYDNFGQIELTRKSTYKLTGGGFVFFLGQLLCGDTVDNIGGLRGWGPVKAYNLLSTIRTEREGLLAVSNVYQECYGDSWKTQLREQCNLVWIVKERNPDGSLKMFNPKDYL